ncbi:unnamed protein product [marine sediment metagenome]|uniref:Uncharacterized protein n=1 Tax=marine sediment metagenome TaxID=412755 RepID=X1PEF0_9ZZZZ
MEKIIIDPVTRIEGHLKVEVLLDGGEVKEARTSGTLFRGFEIIFSIFISLSLFEGWS